jgi:hypothetical protein
VLLKGRFGGHDRALVMGTVEAGILQLVFFCFNSVGQASPSACISIDDSECMDYVFIGGGGELILAFVRNVYVASER